MGGTGSLPLLLTAKTRSFCVFRTQWVVLAHYTNNLPSLFITDSGSHKGHVIGITILGTKDSQSTFCLLLLFPVLLSSFCLKKMLPL